eukprot:g48489.t1
MENVAEIVMQILNLKFRDYPNNLEVTSNLNAVESRIAEFSEKQRLLERKDNELRTKKKELLEMKSRRRQIEQKISTKNDSLKQMEMDTINIEEEERKANAKMKAIHNQKAKLVSELTQLIRQQYAELDEKKRRLLNMCKERMKAAREACDLDPNESDIPSELMT